MYSFTHKLDYLQQKKRYDLLDFFDLAVPVFHSYGHNTDCMPSNFYVIMYIYSCLLVHAFVKDFEWLMVRDVKDYWAFLRRFAKTTKEMTPSHRLDVLTDGIIYYCQLSADQLGKWNYIHTS